MYDIYAPIIPRVGMGGLLLGMSKQEVERILDRPLGRGELLRNDTLEEFIIDDVFALYFSTKNNCLRGMETRKGYKGLLFGKIGTQTHETELLSLDPTLEYNEFEEFYESEANHYQIETSLSEGKAEWIIIFMRE